MTTKHSLTVFAHSAGAFNWTYFMPVFIHTIWRFLFCSSSWCPFIFGGNEQKITILFQFLGMLCFNVGDASSAIVRMWLQSACNIKIHKTQTVFWKGMGSAQIKAHKMRSFILYEHLCFSLKLIAIMSDYIQSLNHRRDRNNIEKLKIVIKFPYSYQLIEF